MPAKDLTAHGDDPSGDDDGAGVVLVTRSAFAEDLRLQPRAMRGDRAAAAQRHLHPVIAVLVGALNFCYD